MNVPSSHSAADFVERWSKNVLREQQAAQSHFNELCQLVGQPTPAQVDPTGEFFTFEKQVIKSDGRPGRADVWYKSHFALEYKGRDKDLDAAYQQLLSYKTALENPPLLVVCDFDEYRIYPQWTNMNAAPFIFHNADLLEPRYRNYIYWLLTNPNEFIEERKRQQGDRSRITENIARDFGRLTDYLNRERDAGHIDWTPMQIARFLTKFVFALFVEDIGLLPIVEGRPVFRYLLDSAHTNPKSFAPNLKLVFEAMNGERSDYATKSVAYFNGKLFSDSQPGAKDGTEVLDLTTAALMTSILDKAADADWRQVDPTIFGTLFEAALDEGKRAQLGAHYTSEQDIRLIVEPVLMAPLQREWAALQTQAEPSLQAFTAADTPPNQKSTARKNLIALRSQFLKRLGEIRVLDPACGSGNFLYVSLKALKDLESHIHAYFAALNLPFEEVVTPHQIYGIEKDPFAAKLAHVVVWIGYLQWRYEAAGNLRPVQHEPANANEIQEPILSDSDNEGGSRILNDDAILRYDADGKPYEPAWPPADVIMGNPPFLGGKRLRTELKDQYVDQIFKLYEGRVQHEADLVCYWFEKARAQIEHGRAKRAGLISTNSIRGGANRGVLDRIKDSGDIFMAWPDQPWMLEGASVRTSLVGFDDGSDTGRFIGKFVNEKAELLIGTQLKVKSINADLTGAADLTAAKMLGENANLIFMGITPAGQFDFPDNKARELLRMVNNSGYENASVIKPYYNAIDITRRPRNVWTIDFGTNMAESEAAKYETAFEYIRKHVFPFRMNNNREVYRLKWWLYAEPRPAMRLALKPLSRYIATPLVSKHRIFVWLENDVVPANLINVIARNDDYFFGVLHSYVHECWALRLGTSLGPTPRYTPTTTFETFPFPWPPGSEPIADPRVIAISAAAKILHEERALWLNPPDLVGSKLSNRTLTKLYNALEKYRDHQREGQAWVVSDSDPATKFAPRLADLHAALDSAVLAAYGWPDLCDRLRTDSGDEEMLRRLLALNGERSAAGQPGA